MFEHFKGRQEVKLLSNGCFETSRIVVSRIKIGPEKIKAAISHHPDKYAVARTKVNCSGDFGEQQIENGRYYLAVRKVARHNPDILPGNRRGICLFKPIWLFSLQEAAAVTTKISDLMLLEHNRFIKEPRRRTADFANGRN